MDILDEIRFAFDNDHHAVKNTALRRAYDAIERLRAAPARADVGAENERLRALLEHIADRAERPTYDSLEVGFRHSPLTAGEERSRLVDCCQEIAQAARAAINVGAGVGAGSGGTQSDH